MRDHLTSFVSALVIVCVAALAVSFALATPARGTSQAQQAEGGITVALTDEPVSMDPCDATYTENNRVITGNITEALVNRDPATGRIVPMLATSWKRLGASSYRFNLRRGVEFSDGKPLTAKVVAASINRVFNAKLNCNVKGFIFSDENLHARAAGANAVEVKSTKADPILPLRMSFIQISEAPAAKKVSNPVGTGPYQLDRWQRGREIDISRNDGYWGKRPQIAQVKYVWRAESSVRANMVKTGQADYAMDIAPQDAQGYAKAQSFPLSETLFLRIDTFAPPMNDVRVRRAMNLAVDRNGLVKSVLKGIGTPATQIILKNINGYNPRIPVWPYQPDKAKQLVAAAKEDGVDVSRPITLYARQGFFANSEQTMEAIAHELNSVGLNVRVKQLETGAWLNDVLLKPFPADRAALTENVHGNNAGDAIFTVVTKFASSGDESTLHSAKVDGLVKKAGSATGSTRTKTFQSLFGYLHNTLVPVIPVAHLNGILMTSKRLDYKANNQSNDIVRIGEMRVH